MKQSRDTTKLPGKRKVVFGFGCSTSRVIQVMPCRDAVLWKFFLGFVVQQENLLAKGDVKFFFKLPIFFRGSFFFRDPFHSISFFLGSFLWRKFLSRSKFGGRTFPHENLGFGKRSPRLALIMWPAC